MFLLRISAFGSAARACKWERRLTAAPRLGWDRQDWDQVGSRQRGHGNYPARVDTSRSRRPRYGISAVDGWSWGILPPQLNST